VSIVEPRLARIRVYPIKSLDPAELAHVRIGPCGGLENDRAWALHSVDGRWVNAKRTAAMHLIRAEYAADLRRVTLSVPGDRRNMFAADLDFPADTERASEWFSAYFEQLITVRHSADGFPDDTLASGPTIVSTASFEAVASWFDLEVEEVRLRFRSSLEIEGVPAFWEDQLFAADPNGMVRFRIGEVNFEGSNPCARCPVPGRDAHTGVDLIGFQKRFIEMRRGELPAWSPLERFDHFYRLSTNTRVPPTECGKSLRVGDALVLSA
jgi:MOSC domain-containing protein